MQNMFLHFALLLIGALSGLAVDKPVDPVNANDGFAVKGYDTVAYFTAGVPTKGSPEYEYRWQGAIWRFANRKHLDMFKSDPARYAPQYGGYCAYAVSRGRTASISPKAWKIVDNKLYLNHSLAQGSFEKDVAGAIRKADKHWPEIPKKPVK